MPWKDLEEFLLARAARHDTPSVVRAGPVALMERIATARAAAVGEVSGRVEHLQTASRRVELDRLLVVREARVVRVRRRPTPRLGSSGTAWAST